MTQEFASFDQLIAATNPRLDIWGWIAYVQALSRAAANQMAEECNTRAGRQRVVIVDFDLPFDKVRDGWWIQQQIAAQIGIQPQSRRVEAHILKLVYTGIDLTIMYNIDKITHKNGRRNEAGIETLLDLYRNQQLSRLLLVMTDKQREILSGHRLDIAVRRGIAFGNMERSK